VCQLRRGDEVHRQRAEVNAHDVAVRVKAFCEAESASQ
jgi:hypothetical protein